MSRHRSYKFTNKHHSKGGIRSSIAAAAALLCTGICIGISYASKGNGANYLVIFAVAAIVCCGYGLWAGNRSFKEEECYYLFSRIGTALNLVLVILWISVIGMGVLL